MKNKKMKNSIFALTVTSVMVAMSVVLCRFVGFSPEGTPLRFELGFLPIAYIAYFLGPVYAAVGYMTADIIGSLFAGYAPNIWITLCQFATGFVFGLFLYKKKVSLTRTFFCFATVAIFIDFLLKSPIFVFMYDWTWEFTLGMRAINSAINLALRVAVYYIFARLINKNLEKISNKF